MKNIIFFAFLGVIFFFTANCFLRRGVTAVVGEVAVVVGEVVAVVASPSMVNASCLKTVENLQCRDDNS